MKKTAVLLINLGTPEAPTEEAVREYLREFLWDPKVVQIPRALWWVILNFFVLKKRPAQSAEAYQKVWTDEGSPLLVNSKRIQLGLQALAEQNRAGQYEIFLAMRYGQPSIESVLDQVKKTDADNIIVLPLYPQFATSSTGTALHAFRQAYAKWGAAPRSKTIIDYHDNEAYINALAHSVQTYWKEHGKAECLLLSFHGVPDRTIKQGDPYLDHCTKTTELLVERLGLKPLQWRMVFQSRFGKAKWIQPYCVETLEALPEEGIKNVDVVCPGFSVDCLETLEEIAMQNKDIFLKAGGENYRYIPALNDDDAHIAALLSLIEENNKEVNSEPTLEVS
ncbi:MAG: ferrochelatase [Cycloclasticus sp.]|jgi:ferrochelatase|nr:ferrochelatase [Cycloclasticus sp.]MEE4290677.1 ferrochelatase [Cycloclasticus sp.]